MVRTKRSSKKRALKRHHRVTLWVVGILSLLLILYLLFGLKVQFIFNEELYLDLSPSHQSFSVATGDRVPINISVSADTPFVCTAYCTYSFTDMSTGEVVDNGSLVDPDGVLKQFVLEVPEKGTGQRTFQFEATCNSKRTNVCRSSEKTYRETVLVTLNYHLDNASKENKNRLKTALEDGLQLNADVEALIARSDAVLDSVDSQISGSLPVELHNLKQEMSALKQLHSDYYDMLSGMLDVWREQEYGDFDEKSLLQYRGRAAALRDSSNSTADELDASIGLWDAYISSLEALSGFNPPFSQAMSFYARTSNSSSYSQGTVLRSEVITTASSPTAHSPSLNGTISDLKNVSSSIRDFTNTSRNARQDFLSRFSNAHDDVRVLLDGLDVNYSVSANATTKNVTCNTFDSLIDVIDTHNDSAVGLLSSSYSHLANVSETTEVCNRYHEFLINDTASSFNLDSSYDAVVVKGYGVVNYSSFSKQELRGFCPVDTDDLYTSPQRAYCTSSQTYDQDLLPAVLIEQYSPLSSIQSNASSSLPLSVTSPPPRCCLDGACKPCCDASANCSENTPVIFVHGHALSRSNSPELSLTAFSQMQEELQGEGYVDAGELDGDSQLYGLPEGDWGRFDAPVSVRVSYYYVSHFDIGGSGVVTQKTERIENYGIRLKEFVDIIKRRTASDDVIIVSHSMGGLVSREYIRLFGSDDVRTLITIGTPNHGIEGSVESYCSVTGAKKECEDMSEGSVFLDRLNKAQRDGIPGTDVYTIRGTGCEMDDGRMGDGVILADNVALSFATNYVVEGFCPSGLFEDTMHTRLVRPHDYPEVFSLVVDILEDAQQQS